MLLLHDGPMMKPTGDVADLITAVTVTLVTLTHEYILIPGLIRSLPCFCSVSSSTVNC